MKNIYNFLKQHKLLVLVIAIPIFLVSLYLGLVFDIGINSTYFAKRDFSKAILLRQTGNCNLFKTYIVEQSLREWDTWEERCIKEKDGKLEPIKSFTIKNITMEENTAFLQVELTKDKLNGDDFSYLVDYYMEKTVKKIFKIIPITKYKIRNESREKYK